MPNYCLFKKGSQVQVLEKNDRAGAAALSARGYLKAEEHNAPDAQQALARYNEAQEREQQRDNAFARREVFYVLAAGMLSVAAWLIFK